MFVTEIRPLNKKKSRILFDDGEDLVLYNGEIRASRIKEQEELPDEVYEKLAGEVLTKRAKHRAMYPVSYTHLDVYKRQRLRWEAAMRAF